MKSYEQPIALVKKHKQRKLNIDPDDPAKDNIYNKVFHGISNKELSSETGLAKNYFNCTPAEPKYKMFKSRFKNEMSLMALNFDMEIKRHSSNYREIVKCYQKYSYLQILVLNGYKGEAKLIAKSLAIKTKKYNLKFIEAECYMLLAHYSQISNNFNSYKKYYKLYDGVLVQYQYINKADKLKFEIISIVNNPFSDINKEKLLITNKLKLFKQYVNASDNPEIKYYYNKTLMVYYHSINEHKKCIEICEETIRFSSKYKFLQGFSKIGDLEREKMI